MTRRQSFELAAIVVIVHLLEDATILSIGRFLPAPIWIMYTDWCFSAADPSAFAAGWY
jgi:hypothetical protein